MCTNITTYLYKYVHINAYTYAHFQIARVVEKYFVFVYVCICKRDAMYIHVYVCVCV